MLPPWEGFDDAGHYSYIQQIADKGSRPHYRDRISAEIIDYLKIAPGPQTLNPRWTYQDFFAAPRATVEFVRTAAHANRDPNRVWRNGSGANWEAQQPPLYYLLMAPLYSISKGSSLVDQLFLLRGVSYGLAWVGLCIMTLFWFRGTSGKSVSEPSSYLAPALWPLFFPMWFPEMARLGNDCLVALLAACAWIVLTNINFSDSDRYRYRYVVLGLICGLGLLTKATFLPLVAAIIVVLLFQIWQGRIAADIVKHRSKGLVTFVVVTIAISGWWYVEQLSETGNIIGSIDMILLSKMGGLLAGLSNNASLLAFANGLLYLAVTFLWGAILTPPLITYLPLVSVVLLLGWGNIRQSGISNLTATDWVALLTLTGLLVGLFNQIAVWIALWAEAAIPGYYLHSFAPILASLAGRGMAGIKTSRLYSRAMLGLLFLPLFFLPLGMIVQAQYLSGCSTDQPMMFYYNVFSSGPCATDLPKIIDNLSVLAFPLQALCCFVAGWIFMFCGALAAVRLRV